MLIPIFALISWRLVFVNRKEYNFTEHLVMAMYIMAQCSLVSSFLNITQIVLKLPSTLLFSASIFLQMAYLWVLLQTFIQIVFWWFYYTNTLVFRNSLY